MSLILLTVANLKVVLICIPMEAKDIEYLSVSQPFAFSLLRILCLDLPSIFKLAYLFSGPAGDGNIYTQRENILHRKRPWNTQLHQIPPRRTQGGRGI